MGLHIQVRNDDHCPVCRIYTITVETDKKVLLQKFEKQILDYGDEQDASTLRKHGNVWIDEWVRRRNGDFFSITPIEADAYMFLDIDTEDKKILQTQTHCRLGLLHVEIDDSLFCPNNIKFYLSCHLTFTDLLQQQLPQYRNTLRINRTLGIPQKQSRGGQFFHIFDLRSGRSTVLNDLCPQLHPKTWFSSEC